jgi:hypothetical protein
MSIRTCAQCVPSVHAHLSVWNEDSIAARSSMRTVAYKLMVLMCTQPAYVSAHVSVCKLNKGAGIQPLDEDHRKSLDGN